MAAGAAGLSTAVACVAAAAAGAGDAGAGDAGVGAGAASDHFWKTVACGRFLYQRFLKIEFWLYLFLNLLPKGMDGLVNFTFYASLSLLIH